ncbi:MAG: quinone oxidoreductase family protein [Candidatus Dormibacteraceae bacterium]
MKAITVDPQAGAEMLRLQDREEPVAAAGQTLIRVLSAGVNFADLAAVRTAAGGPGGSVVPGLEVAGHEVGSGRPVMALTRLGGYAQYAVADSRLVFPADGLDLERAGGFLLPGLTAYLALRHAGRLAEGDEVLILAAAGGVGSAALQAARTLGARRVVGVASSDEKRRRALEAGADEALGYEDDFPPVDLVLDMIGGAVSEKALGSLRELGRLVTLGTASGRPTPPPDPGLLRTRCTAVAGFSFGTLRNTRADWVREAAQPALELIRSGRLRPVAGPAFKLAEAAAAHRLLAARQSIGKMVLVP